MIRASGFLCLSFIVGSALVVSACGGSVEASTSGSASSSSDLSTTASNLTAAQDSLEAARAEAKACFDAYRTCEQAANSDRKACRDTLSTCLPADAPAPRTCGGNAGEARRPKGGEPGHDQPGKGDDHDERGDGGQANAPPAPPPGQEGAPDHERAGKGHDRDGDGGVDRPHQGKGEHSPKCDAPPIPREKLGACRDKADGDLDHGAGAAAAADVHQTCVGKAFGDHIAALCKQGVDFCANAAAPADLCASVTQACK